jgi:hypothetical protein
MYRKLCDMVSIVNRLVRVVVVELPSSLSLLIGSAGLFTSSTGICMDDAVVAAEVVEAALASTTTTVTTSRIIAIQSKLLSTRHGRFQTKLERRGVFWECGSGCALPETFIVVTAVSLKSAMCCFFYLYTL